MATRGQGDVYRVTSAQVGLSEDQSGRTRRYLISMAIRTACFLLAVVVPGWPRWFLIAGAVVLPYLAVVVANAGRENDDFENLETITPLDVRALPPGTWDATTAVPRPAHPVSTPPTQPPPRRPE